MFGKFESPSAYYAACFAGDTTKAHETLWSAVHLYVTDYHKRVGNKTEEETTELIENLTFHLAVLTMKAKAYDGIKLEIQQAKEGENAT